MGEVEWKRGPELPPPYPIFKPIVGLPSANVLTTELHIAPGKFGSISILAELSQIQNPSRVL